MFPRMASCTAVYSSPFTFSPTRPLVPRRSFDATSSQEPTAFSVPPACTPIHLQCVPESQQARDPHRQCRHVLHRSRSSRRRSRESHFPSRCAFNVLETRFSARVRPACPHSDGFAEMPKCHDDFSDLVGASATTGVMEKQHQGQLPHLVWVHEAKLIEVEEGLLKLQQLIVIEITRGTIETRVNLFENELPQCKELRVALWEAKSSGLDQLVRCNEDIFFVAEKTVAIANLSVVAKFEQLQAGNYCVRVTPLQCGPGVEYITIYSKVVELPSALEGSREQTGEALRSRLLWLVLLPLLFVAAVFIALGAIWVRRQYRLARNKPFILASPLATYRKYRVDPGPPVLKVVYSRDSESHVAAVSRLCELLRRELGFRVEWDEAAMHLAHVTPDWAMAMAQLPCPQFNSTAKTAPTVKMLVIESDGALLKHQAYRKHKVCLSNHL
ncbi:hypothetical protein MRX96_044911 [Rhipicephalus microplus]